MSDYGDELESTFDQLMKSRRFRFWYHWAKLCEWVNDRRVKVKPSTAYLECPDCGDVIEVPIVVEVLGESITTEPDVSQVWGHAWGKHGVTPEGDA